MQVVVYIILADHVSCDNAVAIGIHIQCNADGDSRNHLLCLYVLEVHHAVGIGTRWNGVRIDSASEVIFIVISKNVCHTKQPNKIGIEFQVMTYDIYGIHWRRLCCH